MATVPLVWCYLWRDMGSGLEWDNPIRFRRAMDIDLRYVMGCHCIATTAGKLYLSPIRGPGQYRPDTRQAPIGTCRGAPEILSLSINMIRKTDLTLPGAPMRSPSGLDNLNRGPCSTGRILVELGRKKSII